MRLPSIHQYLNALEQSSGLFRTLSAFEIERDAYGDAVMITGSNGVVFKIICDGKYKGLKCYISRRPFTRRIYEYAEAIASPLLCSVKLLPDEVFIDDAMGSGAYYDTVLMDWIAGNTLEREIRRATHQCDKDKLSGFSSRFDRFAVTLLNEEWAHGDIKPENIIVDKNGEFKLIDLDAMFVPSLRGKEAIEMGTPCYQHPARNGMEFGKHIDDYSIAIISVSLRFLAEYPQIYAKFNNSENIILNPKDIISGKSQLYGEIISWAADKQSPGLLSLCRSLQSNNPQIDGLGAMLQSLEE